MSKTTYHGSCKCKRVTFEADIDLAEGTHKCNCTWCWKHRWWSLKVAPESFRPSGGETLDKNRACPECGVMMFSFVPKSEWNPTEYWSVSVAALDDAPHDALAAAPVTYYDGLHDNWWNKPAVTAHL
jgi:hypothetical protein